MTQEKWQADPARGQEFVKPRRDELLSELKNAADVAVAAINANEAEAISRIKAEAGQKRDKINKAIQDMESMDNMRLVRKFWNEDKDTIWRHFLGDRTNVGSIGSD